MLLFLIIAAIELLMAYWVFLSARKHYSYGNIRYAVGGYIIVAFDIFAAFLMISSAVIIR